MPEDDVRAEVTAERREQVAVLESLTPAQWDSPTLCEGWRVREVLAHTTMPYRTSVPRFLLELARSGGRFDRMSDRVARRDAARMTGDELVAQLRDNVGHGWKPPGGGLTGALSHDVIHGLDYTVTLGLGRRVPPARLLVVLGAMDPRSVRYFGVDLDGVALEATDLDWRSGTGTPVRGLAQDLLLVVCGRRLPPGHLVGDGAARFTR